LEWKRKIRAVQKVDAKSKNGVLLEGAKIFTVQEKTKINKNCTKRKENSNNVLILAKPNGPSLQHCSALESTIRTEILSAITPIYRLKPHL